MRTKAKPEVIESQLVDFVRDLAKDAHGRGRTDALIEVRKFFQRPDITLANFQRELEKLASSTGPRKARGRRARVAA